MRVLVFAAHGEQAQELAAISVPTFHAFAQQHGFDVLEWFEPEQHRAQNWTKISALREVTRWCELALWCDVDVIFRNPDDPMWAQALDFYPDHFQAIAYERGGLNTGVWLVRGQDDRTIQFLDAVDSHVDLWPPDAFCFEQTAVRRELYGADNHDYVYPGPEKGTVVLPPVYNDVTAEDPDAFVWHWAGRSHEERLSAMRSAVGA